MRKALVSVVCGNFLTTKRVHTRTMGRFMNQQLSTPAREMTCFSDFPAPKHFPPFMPRGHVVEYLQMYAENFDLLKHIRFNMTVLEINRTTYHRNTGQWRVCHSDVNGNVMESIFDAVMICNGHLSKPFFPAFKGLDGFQGRKLHSHAYKSYRGFEGKVVLVIGKSRLVTSTRIDCL